MKHFLKLGWNLKEIFVACWKGGGKKSKKLCHQRAQSDRKCVTMMWLKCKYCSGETWKKTSDKIRRNQTPPSSTPPNHCWPVPPCALWKLVLFQFLKNFNTELGDYFCLILLLFFSGHRFLLTHFSHNLVQFYCLNFIEFSHNCLPKNKRAWRCGSKKHIEGRTDSFTTSPFASRSSWDSWKPFFEDGETIAWQMKVLYNAYIHCPSVNLQH